MKQLTNNLLKYATSFALLTLVFRFALSASLESNETTLIWISAFLYGILAFIAGWIFGSRDNKSLPLFDVGFRFHFTTYLIFGIISELWFVFGFQSKDETISTVHWTLVLWGFFILIHLVIYLITRKKTIEGLDKSDIFD